VVRSGFRDVKGSESEGGREEGYGSQRLALQWVKHEEENDTLIPRVMRSSRKWCAAESMDG